MPSLAKRSPIKHAAKKTHSRKRTSRRRSCKTGKKHEGFGGRCVKMCPPAHGRVVSVRKHRSRCRKVAPKKV